MAHQFKEMNMDISDVISLIQLRVDELYENLDELSEDPYSSEYQEYEGRKDELVLLLITIEDQMKIMIDNGFNCDIINVQ